MARRQDMPDMRTLDEVRPAPEEALPPPWVSDAAMALEEPSATLPPLGLSEAASAWWLATVEKYELAAHQVRTLSEAACAWDRCQQARGLVNQQGLVVRDTSGQIRPHPAVAIEHDSRLLYLRAMRHLDLETAPLRKSHPGSGGVTWGAYD